jgi:SAM-dependent methyltransferase
MTDVNTLYGEVWAADDDPLTAACVDSHQPRSPDMLYPIFATFGIGEQDTILDIGCRDARYTIELVSRHGCRALAIDPVPLHAERSRAKIAEAGLSDRIRVEQAGIEAMPAADEAIDAIWCRDVLNHVELRPGLAESARVLKPGGRMLVYQTFATELIEPREAARIYAAMAIVPANMGEPFFQAAAADAGLAISGRDVVGSEWRERWAEEGSTGLRDDLVRAARMRRREHALVERFGRARYEAGYADCLWGVYQMLGKLQPTVYVLEKRS